eukprot:6039917-Pleurochrysis_carterae.AAC.1
MATAARRSSSPRTPSFGLLAACPPNANVRPHRHLPPPRPAPCRLRLSTRSTRGGAFSPTLDANCRACVQR